VSIIEIAKIQIRRGQQNITGEPTLSPGEFGWAQDTENLWIGKRVVEGAPDDNNTRILTENDFTALTALTTASGNSVYRYQGVLQGNDINSTSTIFPSTIQRIIKGKLNDTVSILDFYTINTSTSAHPGFQSAVYDLYQRWVGTSSSTFARQTLRIPAGTYYISQPVLIPPYATIVGDGADKTILISSTGTSIFQFCDAVGNTIETAGVFNGADRPKNIYIEGLTFQYSSTLTNLTQNFSPLLRADAAEDSYIGNCKFSGLYTSGAAANNNYAGIEIRADSSATMSQDLIIENSTFDSLATGITSSYDIADTLIVNNRFKDLKRGILHNVLTGTVVPSALGPVRTRVTNNRFENILEEAFFVGDVYGTSILTNHVSAFNTFRDIGLTTTGTFTTAVINYKTLGNVSTGDYFDRLDDVRADRNSYFSTSSWMVSGSSYIDSEQVYKSSLVASSTTTFTILPFSTPTTRARVDYNIAMTNFAREGYFIVNASNITSGATALVTDNYNYTGDNPVTNNLGIVFSANLNTVNQVIELKYTSESGVSGNITYKYSLLQ
jgi:hypothetical protein